MRVVTLLVSLFLLSSIAAVAQVQPPAVADHLEMPPPEVAVTPDPGLATGLSTEQVLIRTVEAVQDRSEAQASDRLTQFLYSVAVGVAVAVLSTLILRAII